MEPPNHDIESTFPHVKDLVYNNFYMDDFYESTDSIREAQRLFSDVRFVLQSGSFKLRKWKTINSDILASIPKEYRAISFDELLDKTTTKRILGIQWNISSDFFFLANHILRPTEKETNSTESASYSIISVRLNRNCRASYYSPTHFAAKCLETRTLMGRTYQQRQPSRIVHTTK